LWIIGGGFIGAVGDGDGSVIVLDGKSDVWWTRDLGVNYSINPQLNSFLNLETWVNVDHNEGEDDAHFSTNEWSQAVIDATLRFEDNHPLIN